MVKSLDERIEKLLSKTEAMVLLCSKASSYWSMIKFGFNIPLVLTSSAMCIINSISEVANEVKIPNIVVNAISVLIISLNNSIKASEKCDLFRRLGQQFLLLSGQIENDNEITDNDFNIIAIKYENLVNDVLFEDIPHRFCTKYRSLNRLRIDIYLFNLMERLEIINALIRLREKLLFPIIILFNIKR